MGVRIFTVTFLQLCVLATSLSAQGKGGWEKEWNALIEAAKKEGEVTIYGRPQKEHRAVFDAFEAAYPGIKLNYDFTGPLNYQRVLTERRAGKYLVDMALVGAPAGIVLVRGNALNSIPPALILPENMDPSAWFGRKQPYADPEGERVFIMGGRVSFSVATYNTRLIGAREIRSHWNLLNSKWKDKIAVFDPTTPGHLSNWKGIYYSPRLGPEFIRRFFGEMEPAVSRDQRLILDGVAKGKFHLAVPSINDTDVQVAKRQGLPVDLIEGPPEETYISSRGDHVVLLNRAPHPNAAKVLLNWLLSRKGQLEFQRRTDVNSLRMDIPKDMLSEPRTVPKQGGEYLMVSLPQYEDTGQLLKVIKEVLEKNRRR